MSDTPPRPAQDSAPRAVRGDAPRAARPRCASCQRPLSSCLCRWVRPTLQALPVLVLQHPAEQAQAKGSLRLLQLSLQPCQVEVGEQFDPLALARWLAMPLADSAAANPASAPVSTPAPAPPSAAAPPSAPRPGSALTRSLLLYPVRPGDPTTAALPLPLADPAGWRLVLLDGTWRQTRQMLRLNPLLQSLPRWALPAPPPSRYAIRRAQRPDQRSTLEAACLALAALQGDAQRFAPLLAAFDGWVAAELARRPPA
ncbi:MAG: DTW domain-containing protein [Microbacteriaceae bacterium]|nr:DTW domain-containing protein [Burkholderiaceae bacterium]